MDMQNLNIQIKSKFKYFLSNFIFFQYVLTPYLLLSGIIKVRHATFMWSTWDSQCLFHILNSRRKMESCTYHLQILHFQLSNVGDLREGMQGHRAPSSAQVYHLSDEHLVHSWPSSFIGAAKGSLLSTYMSSWDSEDLKCAPPACSPCIRAFADLIRAVQCTVSTNHCIWLPPGFCCPCLFFFSHGPTFLYTLAADFLPLMTTQPFCHLKPLHL